VSHCAYCKQKIQAAKDKFEESEKAKFMNANEIAEENEKKRK
jgi:hypothetical protein